MNEFIEKLIGRLEEESDYEPIDYDYCDMSCSGEEHFISTHKAIEIVNRLAEEYKGGCCEWKKYENDIIFPYKTSCGTSDLYDDSYKYCPYCGKKIEIVPYNPKGE